MGFLRADVDEAAPEAGVVWPSDPIPCVNTGQLGVHGDIYKVVLSRGPNAAGSTCSNMIDGDLDVAGSRADPPDRCFDSLQKLSFLT